MAIAVITGPTGSGKTLYALQLLEQQAVAGRPCYTNIQLTPACPWSRRVALMDDDRWSVYRGSPAVKGKSAASKDYMAFWHYVVPGSFILVDEADLYFDCTDYGSMGNDIRQFHKQHRKLGLDIVYIVQSLQNLYCRIVRLAQKIVVCDWDYRSNPMLPLLERLVGQGKRLSRYHRWEFYELPPSEKSFVGKGWMSHREASRYFSYYKTEQIIGDVINSAWASYASGNLVDGCNAPPDAKETQCSPLKASPPPGSPAIPPKVPPTSRSPGRVDPDSESSSLAA